MADVEQFVPAGSGDDPALDRDGMREVSRLLRPDYTEEQFDVFYAGFTAMRARVENPRRRLGGDVKRCGPVLFDPCQYYKNGDSVE